MASPSNFTLDDHEEADFVPSPMPSVVPVAPSSHHPVPDPLRPTPPTFTYPPLAVSPSYMSIQLRDPPKSHIDSGLGVSTLAQVSHVLQENQQHIEEAEAHLQTLMRQHARLVAAGRLLEQQKVLDVLSTGPELGYDAGRPVASLLVYRCCLRWGCFTGDSQAATILDNLSALLLAATDEDAILARTTAMARARVAGTGTSSGGGGEEGRAGTIVPSVSEEGAQVEQVAVAAATREVAYWLSVTSVLLALIDPHLPLTSLSRTPPGGAAAAAEGGAGVHLPTPLAVVAGDARASMARAASAAAAKVQELQKRMGNTISGMQLLGKNLLMRRRGKGGEGGAAAHLPGGPVKPEGADAGQLDQVSEQGGGVQEAEATAAGEVYVEASPSAITINVSGGPGSLPSLLAGSNSSVRSSSPSGGPTEPSAGPASSASVPAPAPAVAMLHPPQTAFRQQLDLLVQKTYVQMRDSLKRHVSAVLPGCVQLHVSSTYPWNNPGRGEGPASGGGAAEQQEGSTGGAPPSGLPAADGSSSGSGCGGALSSSSNSQAPSLQPWLDLISVLSHHLALLREAHVPRILIRCLYKQTLAFVDVQLFNQLLLRPECCSTSNARYLVEGLQLLDAWLTGSRTPGPSGVAAAAGARGHEALDQGHLLGPTGAGTGTVPVVMAAGEELAVLAEDLRHIRQAAHFLVLVNKGALRLDDFTAMCPALNVQQLYRLATTFWDDSPLPPPPQSTIAQSAPLRATPGAGGGEPAATVEGVAAAVGDAGEAGVEAQLDGEAVEGGSEAVSPMAANASPDATCGEGEQDAVKGLGAAEGGQRMQPDAAVMEAAEAAVVAAAAAAAADEAGGAPEVPPPPQAAQAAAAAASVSRNVSGEVLEEMKRRHSVANNGGLIVTFLLDEDSVPLIVQGTGGSGGGGGVVARQLLQIINEPRLHEGLTEGLPPALRTEDCPPQAFAFMIDDGEP